MSNEKTRRWVWMGRKCALRRETLYLDVKEYSAATRKERPIFLKGDPLSVAGPGEARKLEKTGSQR